MEWIFDNENTKTSEGSSITWHDNQFFTIEFEGIHYHGEILQELSEDQKLVLKINHRVFNIRKKHALDDLIHSLGLDKPKTRKLKSYHSPMPGRVLSINIKVGETIEQGMALLSLEAMKMENTLKSEGIGTVKEILISVGSVVEKGALLIEFE